MNKRIFLTLLFASVLTLQTRAQSVLGIEYPFGIPVRTATGPSLAMGGAGTGVINDFNGFALNPGNLGAISRATFSSALSFDFLNILDNGSHTNHVRFFPELLSFAFPFPKYGTFALSVDQRSVDELSYFKSNVPIHATDLTTIDSVDVGYIKDGGTTSWQAGWGYNILGKVYVGLAYERIFLTDITSFVKEAQGTISTTIFDSTYVAFRGNGIRAGVLIPLKALSVGFSGEYIFAGHGDTAEVLRDVQGSGFDSTNGGKFALHMPPTLNGGIAYAFTPEWLGAADISATLWSRYYSDLSLGNKVSDAYSFHAGAQFVPAPNLLLPQYWEIMQYCAGIQYTQLPLSTASEYAFSLGLGLPIQQAGGLFNVVLEYGRRSDTRFSGYKEEFASVQIGLNGGRKWTNSSGASY